MGLRVDARPFSLEGREFVRKIIRDPSPEIICPKAAQMCYTVTAITKTLHNVTERNWNGLYLLPLKTGAIPFVQGRIDTVIESNEALAANFGSVDNRLHKQTREGVNLYIRGTNIERELHEVPVDFQIWDEYDRMVIENLDVARHRMDGSEVRKLLILSTPTVDGYGVYAEDAWDDSDQHRWEIPCPSCSRYQVLNFDEPSLDYSNLKIGDKADECVVECAYCKYEIRDKERSALNAEGRWTAMNPDGRIRGYHISQLNSPTQPLYEIVKDFFAGQRDIRKLRSFWNQNMGRAFAAPGDKFTPEILDKCRQANYVMGGIPNSFVSLGIDVGTVLHLWGWHFDASKRKMLWTAKIFRNWQQLEDFLGSLTSWTGVIDAQPEKTKAHDLAMKFHGRLRVGFSEDRMQASEMANFFPIKHGEAGRVNIDRTMALDTFIADFINGRAILPPDARELGEDMPKKHFNGLYHQLCQMVRIEEENTKGQIVGRWKHNTNPDHWHHAGMMATVASEMVPTLVIPSALSTGMNRNVIGA
jgi:Phage terminase large subunit gpA, ATPase domain/Terminase large subunit gpA, endonuclease domain